MQNIANKVSFNTTNKKVYYICRGDCFCWSVG